MKSHPGNPTWDEIKTPEKSEHPHSTEPPAPRGGETRKETASLLFQDSYLQGYFLNFKEKNEDPTTCQDKKEEKASGFFLETLKKGKASEERGAP